MAPTYQLFFLLPRNSNKTNTNSFHTFHRHLVTCQKGEHFQDKYTEKCFKCPKNVDKCGKI